MHDEDRPTVAAGGEDRRREQETPVRLDRLEPGATLGRYVVLERIGSGGMGVVSAFAATDLPGTGVLAERLVRAVEARGARWWPTRW